jgi:exonuclease VII small subunit
MGKELWREERDQLQAVLSDLNSGKIRLEQGHDDYLDGLKRRIAHLEEKLAAQD